MSTARSRWCTPLLLTAALLGMQQGCSSDAAAPRPVAILLKTAPSQAAETMIKLGTQPVLQAADASGNPIAVAGIAVTASVTSGDGRVAGGATATTDANGVAAFQRLTLGANNGIAGAVTLSFDSPGLKPVTSQVALACSLQTVVAGATVATVATVADSLSAGDCTRNAGFLFNQYTVNVDLPTKALRLQNSASYVS